MASQWYLQNGDEERGPISFRELTDLVRSGEVTEDDLVRPTWKQDWQRADTVVGLFYMARRSAADLAALDAPTEPSAGVRPVGVPASAGGTAPAPQSELDLPEERPGWMKRLWSLRSAPLRPRDRSSVPQGLSGVGREDKETGRQGDKEKASGPSSPCLPLSLSPCLPSSSLPSPPGRGAGGERRAASTSADSASPPTALPPELATFSEAPAPTSDWSHTIDAALAHTDQRASAAKTPRSRLGRAFAKLTSPFVRLRDASGSTWLRPAFRIVCAIVGAILIALAIESWSSQAALRFPSLDPQIAALRDFPLLGKCSPAEYLFLTFDAMLLTGACAYFSARWLESRAE